MPQTAATAAIDLNDPSLYINRELSWLEFNYRVLQEAQVPETPLLERLRFLTIVSSNLDEFFMVRVAGLRRQVKSQTVQRGPDGMTAEEQLSAIGDRCHTMVREQYRCLSETILPGLAEHGVVMHRMTDLSGDQARWVKDYFHRQVFPVLTPLALDPGHPFPHLRNRSLNLIVTLKKGKGGRQPVYLAVVQVPTVIPRLVQVPGAGFQFVLLEDVICEQIAELFQGLTVTGCYPFRITRDSDLNFDEDEAEDLLEKIEQEVRKREWGESVRLEVTATIGQRALTELLESLELTEQSIYSIDGPLNLVDFTALCRLPEYPHLRDQPFVPPIVRQLQGDNDLFKAIRKGDILLHHPYESFNTVVDFVEQAADDPNVLAIKQTLYRTSGDSPIVNALARAAQNGKQVTALVELKARFDEENNIVWARALERAGVHVVYGLVGLKTHCKLLMVIRREEGEERLRRYIHLGTGNYHPTTARLYTDLGLLTCNLKFGQDVSRLFNVLTGFSEFPQWRKLSVAPLGMRDRILELIDRETKHAQAGRKAEILAQMNSLAEPDVIRALYRASQAGVKISMVIRGICCLRAGVPGVSENIRVISIVGRFLEHCRIAYFRNGGDEEVYLASSDWMNRNLFRRVETMFPVDDPALRRHLIDDILGLRLKDNVKARVLQPDGSYARIKRRRGEHACNSQQVFLERALEEHAIQEERAFSLDLLLHEAAHDRNSATRPVSLTELHPMRTTPPELPSDDPHPPDPRAPDDEIVGVYGSIIADIEASDASGL